MKIITQLCSKIKILLVVIIATVTVVVPTKAFDTSKQLEPSGTVVAIDWNYDGILATVYAPTTIVFQDRNMQILNTLSAPSPISTISWGTGQSSNILAVGSYNGGMFLVTLQTLQFVQVQGLMTLPITQISWKSDGTRIAVAENKHDDRTEGDIYIWDIQSLSITNVIVNKDMSIGDTLSWKPNTNLLSDEYTTFSDTQSPDMVRPADQIAIWDSTTSQLVQSITLPDSYETVSTVAWNPTGDRLAAGRKQIYIWDGSTLALLSTFVPSSSYQMLKWSPDGERLVIVTRAPNNTAQSIVSVIDERTGYDLYSVIINNGYIKSIAWSPDGKQLALGGFTYQPLGPHLSIIDVPNILNINLTSLCSKGTLGQLIWSIKNLHPVDINFTWIIDNSTQTGSGVAKAQSDTTFQTTPVGGNPNTAHIFVNGVLQDTATNDATQCPATTNTPTSTATVTLTSTATITQSPTRSPIVTNTPSRTTTASVTSTPTSTVTHTPTATLSPTVTLTPTPNCTSITAHKKTIGVYRPSNNTFYLRNTNTSGGADITVAFGTGTVYPVVGDWNGDGIDTIGTFGALGSFSLRDSNSAGAATYQFTYGTTGDTPLVGRWLSTQTHDSIGIYRNANGVMKLITRNSLTTGNGDLTEIVGNPGDQPIAGDWNCDGVDSIGVYRPGNGNFYLFDQDINGTGLNADYIVNLSTSTSVTYTPIAGDWTGIKRDGVGLFTGTTFKLKNIVVSGAPDLTLTLGTAGDIPVVGKWQ